MSRPATSLMSRALMSEGALFLLRYSDSYCSEICPVEPLYCGHLGDLVKCPVQRGVLISGVNLQHIGHSKVLLIQRCPYSGVSFKRAPL